MTTKFEVSITFCTDKLKLLQRIYNLRVSHPKRKIFLALADICACFCFPRVHADLMGAFGFMAEEFNFWQQAWILDPMIWLVVGNHF
jgi:hypothetical protein